ncbi:MAG: hypothetical protein A2096_01585 [Spirochaetes bacterium GWF1_41_5]|nr:MAG: hypothetical protein A2096_01585 [Spirochaetes bacterium GWF1_41_5]
MNSRGIMLIGYDVERIPGRVPGDKWAGIKFEENSTEIFLASVLNIHQQLKIPATLFVVGSKIKNNLNALKKCLNSGLFEIAQHTYNHVPLKTIIEDSASKVYLKGIDFNKIDDEIKKPAELLKKHLNVDCRGITTPYTFFRGLSDRPDILEIINRHKIKYIRSCGRNYKDYFPLGWNVEPYTYKIQGFPNLLEIPVHGWIDAQWRHDHGWEKWRGYVNYIKKRMDLLSKNSKVWSLVQHDWTSIYLDHEMKWTKKIIEYGIKKNIKFMTHYNFYQLFFQEKT